MSVTSRSKQKQNAQAEAMGKVRQPACGEQLATRTKVLSLALRKEKQQLKAAGTIAALAIAEGKKARERGTPL